MEEKKKRERPTWAMVRELEQHISALIDERESLEEENKALKEERNSLKYIVTTDEALMNDKLCILEQSNKVMEAELKRLRGVIAETSERCREKDETIFRLMHRSLVDRILNRKV